MPQKTGGPLAHVQPHPPFPSFSWVMAAQANPPSPAFAYGYVRNARAQSGMHTRPPARRTVPPELHQQPRHPHSAKPPQPPPPQRATRAKGGAVAAEHDESFMESVDYRFHDPPSRPYVPWLEGYTMRGRGAQRQVYGTRSCLLPVSNFSLTQKPAPALAQTPRPPLNFRNVDSPAVPAVLTTHGQRKRRGRGRGRGQPLML
ncbi:hypothetical protein BJV77DRAFT_343978 [Russula vinacea]|nr:hypothetical protein BJV77DRAFT_343978 [Russula vinacea]